MKQILLVLIVLLLALVASRTEAAPLPFSKDSSYYSVEFRDGVYHVDMKQSIEDIRYYNDLIRGLGLLTKEDVVVFHLANYGGSVFTGAALFNAVLSTPATTRAVIDAPSFSMGAMLPCATDSVLIPPHSFLMYHTWSGSLGGKSSDNKTLMSAIDRLTKGMLQQCKAHGLLTSADIDEIMEGKDKYVFPGDLK